MKQKSPEDVTEARGAVFTTTVIRRRKKKIVAVGTAFI